MYAKLARTGVSTVVIVVFDDGVQTTHPDLNTLAGQDFTSAGTGGQPGNVCDNHGTAVAGCITAKINNGFGVVGVAPDCRVRSAKIGISDLGSPCPSTFLMFDSWLVRSALAWAVGEASVEHLQRLHVPRAQIYRVPYVVDTAWSAPSVGPNRSATCRTRRSRSAPDPRSRPPTTRHGPPG